MSCVDGSAHSPAIKFGMAHPAPTMSLNAICCQSTDDPITGAEVLAADLKSDLVGFVDCHGDREVVSESILIDRLAIRLNGMGFG